ncbi:MAG TPA: hypothetical protein VK921_16785 [Anditalea sp.]|nr:hypothetical protein [Anditalea sp.]
MKKLFMFFILMGVVTALNAQSVTFERDIFTEQIMNSVSSFKLNAEKFLLNSSYNGDSVEVKDDGKNAFQYIRQQADFISIASTAYDAIRLDAEEMVEGLEGSAKVLEGSSGSNAVQYLDEITSCPKNKRVKS